MADATGNTPMHWAAKTGDLDVIRNLHRAGASLHQAATTESRMFPIHWAASDGKISSIKYLVDNHVDINALDSNGCSPLTIATQHQQTTVAIWLVKNGADMDIGDMNGDTAMHWAAYKGFIELVGVFRYLRPQLTVSLDNFGQTPLHLASMRGNMAVAEYLATGAPDDCNLKDRNGAKAIDLAIKKKNIKIEFMLRKLTSKTIFHEIYDIGLGKCCSARYCSLLACGYNESEVKVWAWRVVCYSNLIASLITAYFISGPLSDHYIMGFLNVAAQCFWWFCFLGCLLVEPGYVKDKDYEFLQDTGLNYGSALDIIGSATGAPDEPDFPAMCHSCHVRRPIRAKHDKVTGKCIHKFDHFCPFVGNAVARDNYKYFVGLLFIHVVCYFLFMVSSWQYSSVEQVSWTFICYLVYSTVWFFMICGLLNYHLVLIMQAMTTNEQIGMHKYKYFKNAAGMIENPFDKKDFWLNFSDAMFPSRQVSKPSCMLPSSILMLELYLTTFLFVHVML
jgi:palmitoyltransferase ZDHHC13/17